MHTLLRHAADPTRDTGGGEPPYDCFGASRRRFVARGAQCHGPWVDKSCKFLDELPRRHARRADVEAQVLGQPIPLGFDLIARLL